MHQHFSPLFLVQICEAPTTWGLHQELQIKWWIRPLFCPQRSPSLMRKKTSRWTITIQCPQGWTCVNSGGTRETKARRWAGWVIVKDYHQRRLHMLIHSPMQVYLKIPFWQTQSQMHSTGLIQNLLCTGDCAESGVAELNSWHDLFFHGAYHLSIRGDRQ